MKRALLLVLALIALSPALHASDKKKKSKSKTEAVDTTAIKWMTVDEVQVAMKKAPKKVFMDVYTDWCGWCKVMDKKTFSNANVIKYLNEHFYSVKFNAEQKDSIRFMGKMYGFVPQYRANMFAVELMKGQMSYPTSVILEEDFQNPQPIPGYLDVATIEKILKYIGGNTHKTKNFQEFEKEFVASWAETTSPAPGSAVPPGH
jgi:thioredoxin-related protein